MNGQVTAETIKMLVQANNTIADLLEMLAIEKTYLEMNVYQQNNRQSQKSPKCHAIRLHRRNRKVSRS